MGPTTYLGERPLGRGEFDRDARLPGPVPPGVRRHLILSGSQSAGAGESLKRRAPLSECVVSDCLKRIEISIDTLRPLFAETPMTPLTRKPRNHRFFAPARGSFPFRKKKK